MWGEERVLPGYLPAVSGGGRWVARPECAADLARGAADRLLAGGRTGRAAAGRGRGGLVEFRLGGIPAIGKPARHGGLFGSLLDGLYLGPDRALIQIAIAGELCRRGVDTPEPLAVGWRRVLGPLVLQAIVTRAIPEGRNLLEVARDGDPRIRREALAAGAEVVRAMHDAGFDHADLNLMNLVFETRPAGARVQVVDLDRGRFLDRLGPGSRRRALGRLLRSHDKWVEPGRRLTPREEIRFLRRYCRTDRGLLRSLVSGLRRARARQRVWRRVQVMLGLRRTAPPDQPPRPA